MPCRALHAVKCHMPCRALHAHVVRCTSHVAYRVLDVERLTLYADVACCMLHGMLHAMLCFACRMLLRQTAADLLMEDGDCIVVCEAGEPSDPTTLWRRLLRKALADPSAFGDVLGRSPLRLGGSAGAADERSGLQRGV